MVAFRLKLEWVFEQRYLSMKMDAAVAEGGEVSVSLLTRKLPIIDTALRLRVGRVMLDTAGKSDQGFGGSLSDVYDRLKRRIEATKAIRFESHRRLKKRDRMSSYVVSMLSLYVIGLSLVPNIFTLRTEQSQLLLACTIVISVFIIILSLTEGSESFHHKAELLHGSARELNNLTYKLSLITNNSQNAEAVIKNIAAEYENVIRLCPVNHEQSDFYKIKARCPELFGYNNIIMHKGSKSIAIRLLAISSG
jgi:hypothetical protein